jgi:serine/threonine protein phosphatase 1
MRSKKQASAEKALVRTIAERPRRIYAFGDIHGCYDELDRVLQFLINQESAGAEDQFIFIGDYIDRGPSSRQVLERLIRFKGEFPKTVFLKGNHEDMLLDFLGLGGSSGEVYLANGGIEFFKSYGIVPEGALSEIRARLPEAHLEFVKNLEHGVSLGEFIFVHAGIDPQIDLSAQKAHTLMWVRAQFIQKEHNLGKTVVFGHTPFEDVMLHLPYKIGIDTGLVYGNRLTVVELVEGGVYQIDRGGEDVYVSSLKDRLDSGS